MNLGEKLRAYRKLNGITQEELARRLGVDPTTLARWEKRKSRPMEKNLKAIKQLFKSLPMGIFSHLFALKFK